MLGRLDIPLIMYSLLWNIIAQCLIPLMKTSIEIFSFGYLKKNTSIFMATLSARLKNSKFLWNFSAARLADHILVSEI